jgi:predicted neuraminidase
VNAFPSFSSTAGSLITAIAALLIAPAAAAERQWQGIPGIERTAGGRLFVTWFSGGTTEPHADNSVYLATSDDGGETFSEPVEVAPARGGARAFDPTLWIDPAGSLQLIFNRGNPGAAEHDVWRRICREPDAKSPVWAVEEPLAIPAAYAFRMNKPTVLSSGEWVLPVTHAREPVKDRWFAGEKQLQGVAISSDQGCTWTLHGAVEAPSWALENMIVERRDGTLWMLIRTGGGELWESISTDRGRTWSPGQPSGIRNPGSRFFIRRLASGNLLLVNHAGHPPTDKPFTGRSHLTAQVSSDDGRSWSPGLLLDERSGVSYPDAVETPDGTILAIYDRDRTGDGEILLARFKEADALAGRDVSGAVRLRQVVSQTPPRDASRAKSQPILPAGWDPHVAAERVLAGLVNISEPRVKGAHDSDFLIVGDKAYVVSMANDVQAGEAPTWPFIYSVLTVVNLATKAPEKSVVFAASGQAYANNTLPPGACFVPRILRHDADTLRCFFASEEPGKRQSQTWRIDYDLASGEFSNEIHPVELQTSLGVFPMQPAHFHAHAAARGFTRPAADYGLYPIDGFKEYDGQWHAVLNNFASGQLAWARLDDRHERFTILGDFFLPNDLKTSESAVERLPDGSWCAVSRQEEGTRNSLFSTSPDGVSWTPHAPRAMIPNGTNSKSIFHRFNGVYYLGWQEATQVEGVFRSVFNIEVSRDGRTWERKYRFQTPKSFQYPTLREHAGTIYLTVTQGDHDASRKERIMFGVLE